MIRIKQKIFDIHGEPCDEHLKLNTVFKKKIVFGKKGKYFKAHISKMQTKTYSSRSNLLTQ